MRDNCLLRKSTLDQRSLLILYSFQSSLYCIKRQHKKYLLHIGVFKEVDTIKDLFLILSNNK